VTPAKLRRTAVISLLVVAVIAATVSFIHIQHLAMLNRQGWLASVLLPFSIDGTVATASIVMLDAAKRSEPVPKLARWMLGLSIGATIAANVGYGMSNPVARALLCGWTAVAFAGSVELFIGMVRRNAVTAPRPPVARRPKTSAPVAGPVAPPPVPALPEPAPAADMSQADIIRRAVAQFDRNDPDLITRAWTLLKQQGYEFPRQRVCDTVRRDGEKIAANGNAS
jgi:Protein of unknown function (DUF2637)